MCLDREVDRRWSLFNILAAPGSPISSSHLVRQFPPRALHTSHFTPLRTLIDFSSDVGPGLGTITKFASCVNGWSRAAWWLVPPPPSLYIEHRTMATWAKRAISVRRFCLFLGLPFALFQLYLLFRRFSSYYYQEWSLKILKAILTPQSPCWRLWLAAAAL